MRTALVYNFLLEANVMASIAIVLLFFARRFLRKPLGNSALRFSWLLVAARLLLPLSLPNPFIREIRPAALYADTAIRPIAGQIRVRLEDALSEGHFSLWHALGRSTPVGDGLLRAANGIENGSAARLLMRLYMLGAGLVLLWFILSNVLFLKKMRERRIGPVSGEIKTRYEQLCSKRGVRPVPVFLTDPLPSACLVGLFRPYIALPLIDRPQDAVQALTHEVCHLKGHDHWWALVRMLCCAVHWFNPLVWAAARMCRTDSELACDDRVTACMDDPEKRAYAQALVLSASRKNAPGLMTLATGMTMTGKRLKRRIDAILRAGPARRWLAVGFAVLSSMLLVGAFATSEVQRVWNLQIPSADISDWTLDGEMLSHLASDEEDLNAFSAGVWESPYLAETRQGIPFDLRQENGRFLLQDSRQALTMVFDGEGRLTLLSNDQSGYTDAQFMDGGSDFPTGNLMDNDGFSALDRYLTGFIDSFAPDLLKDNIYWTLDEQWRSQDTYFGTWTLRVPDRQGKDSLPCQVELELTPDFRVVRFYRFGEEEDTSYLGNG